MQLVRSIWGLMRPGSSLTIPLMVFVPLFARTRNLDLSIGRAIPLFFIALCTFIANGIDDIERDRINHPERPLPSGQISSSSAAAIYFVCLGLALFTIRVYIDFGTAFGYYAIFLLSTSYGYIVDYIPSLKSFYVAGIMTLPVLLVAASFPRDKHLYVVAGAVCFFILGKELLMDILDRAGDSASFMHSIEPKTLATSAFTLEAIGLLLLVFQVHGAYDFLLLASLITLTVLSGIFWFKMKRYSSSILLMKIQLLAGLYFLL